MRIQGYILGYEDTGILGCEDTGIQRFRDADYLYSDTEDTGISGYNDMRVQGQTYWTR